MTVGGDAPVVRPYPNPEFDSARSPKKHRSHPRDTPAPSRLGFANPRYQQRAPRLHCPMEVGWPMLLYLQTSQHERCYNLHDYEPNRGQPHQIRVRVENSAVTDSTATIVVTLTNPESTNQTVNLRYRTPRGSGTWEVVSPLPTSTTSREFTLGSLMPNSNYEVQASLDSNFQTGVRSTSFTTHGPPTNLRLRVAPRMNS